MVDFSKLGTQPREIDYLAYLIDECELNSWCKGAFPGMLEWLRGNSARFLSVKQRASLDRAIKDYDLQDDIKQGFLVRGYANRTDVEVLNNSGTGIQTQSTKMAQAGEEVRKDRHGFDADMDDDISWRLL